jgi:uncharacterized repeat protein (TIGR01451 family)
MKKLIFLLPLILSSFFISAQFGSQNDISRSLGNPNDVKSFDLDNDGDLDLLIASRFDWKIAWYENLGGGIFRTQQIISLNAPNAWSVYATDLDNDGDLDVLSASTTEDKVAWYENQGGGSFGEEQIITTTANGALSVYASDLDGDGDMDVLSAQTWDIAWYENLGNGVFGSQQIVGSANASSVHSFDFDGDGDMDILSNSSAGDKVLWYENQGNGIFGAIQLISSNADGVDFTYAEDLDNDGDLDVLSASENDDKIAWYENLGGGVFSSEQIISTSFDGAKYVFASDLDGDGDIDILSASYSGDKVVWFENLGGGTIDTTQIIISTSVDGVTSIFVADIDEDGDGDILSTSGIDDAILIFKNLGLGNFSSQPQVITSISEARSVHASDLDNDGDQDVLSASSNDDKIAWYENLGDGTFGSLQLISSSTNGAISVYAADLDGDGDMDVLSAGNLDSTIAWHENLGGGVIDTNKQIISNSAWGAYSVYSADLDGDGDMDVLSASGNDNDVSWYENLGNGVFVPKPNFNNSADGARCVYAADLDGDGDLDVLSASMYDYRIDWYENLGGGTFGARQYLDLSANGATSVYATDLDSDGDLDVLYTAPGDNEIRWVQNLGGGAFGSPQIISVNSGDISIYSVDLDGDGDMDVMTSKGPSWYENFGGGVFGPQQALSISTDFAFVFASDLDSDGDMEMLLASLGQSKILWHENYFNSPFQLKGKLFYDENQNGELDSVEVGLPFIELQLQPTELISYTANNGNYFFATDTGTYTVSYSPDSLWALITDSSSFTGVLSDSIPIIDSLNFGFYPDTILTIITPTLTGGTPRCNQITNYWINVQNHGTTVPNGTIHLQLDDSLSYISSSVLPDSIDGQNLYWHFDSLFYFSEELINLQVIMPSFINMGDTLTSLLTVNELNIGGNVIYTNNYSLKQVSICSYDPNDKAVFPKGSGPEGYISQNQELEYLIRFQNTGNDTAITVMIRDQLDANLDWNTLQLVASSHPMQAWIEQDGEAVFKFESIMLPDSNVNELGSHGFVKFKISPKSGLLPNTQVFNTGHIYFDFNPAVITNTVKNTIECYNTPTPSISLNFPYLESGVSGNYNYQWFLNDSLIVGATEDTLIPVSSGDYSVEVIDSNGCYKESQPYSFVILNISKLDQLKTIVYPNPFRESTTILFDKNLNGNYSVLVYNVIGAEVKQINKITGNKANLSKNDIGKGLFLTYLINTETGEKIFIEKLIVQ